MDTREYIASGILQDYVAGTATEQEVREVQCLSAIYPEVREALDLIESDMESFVRAYAKKAPSELRDRIMKAVEESDAPGDVEKDKSAFIASAKTAAPPEAVVKEMKAPEPESRRGGLPIGWAAAAAVLLAFGIWQFAENAAKDDKIAALEMQQEAVNERIQSLAAEVEAAERRSGEVFDPAVKKVVLSGTDETQTTQVALLWNTETGEVRLNPRALPELPDDLQYQLWVLVDGNPVDMGVLPRGADQILTAEKMTKEGQTFAVTAEPLGGMPTPTLEQLVVIGDVA